MSLPVLLIGSEALALVPRLELSGYRPLRLTAGEVLEDIGPAETLPGEAPRQGGSIAADPPGPAGIEAPVDPAAVVLSPGEEARIPALRRRWGAVPILLGIVEDSVEGRARTLISGADDFWLTGLGPSDLLTRLRLHGQMPAVVPAAPQRLQVADLLVIPSTRLVNRGDRRVTLTAREYQLLLLLLEHRGRVVSREEILHQVWQDQQGSASNVIEVYVRYLRQKLEEGGERRLIHTVRGSGYCLSEGLPPAPDAR
ncbi:MAG: winged helix-turn-helix domain-containing protein [Cyanobium sp.]